MRHHHRFRPLLIPAHISNVPVGRHMVMQYEIPRQNMQCTLRIPPPPRTCMNREHGYEVVPARNQSQGILPFHRNNETTSSIPLDAKLF